MNMINNPCPSHKEQNDRFCHNCGLILCPVCSMKHQCASKKKALIESIDEDLLDNFQFERFLGSGSYGKIFQVTSTTDECKYALKVIEGVGPGEFHQAKTEIGLLAKINHPNIVRLYGSNWMKGKELLWMTLELCDCSLDSCLDGLDQATAFEYFRQICEGVRALHLDHKIIHRDLKPGNILMKGNVPKVCDFGESKKVNKDLMSLSMRSKDGFGTLSFLAPEIIEVIHKEAPNYTNKSDVWALGIIFHKMLAKNRHPFLEGVRLSKESKDFHRNFTIVKAVLQEKQAEFDSSITNPRYLAILSGCLEKKPEKRMNIEDLIKFCQSGKLVETFPKEIPIESVQQEVKKTPFFQEKSSIKGVFLASACFSPSSIKVLTGGDSRDPVLSFWDFATGTQISKTAVEYDPKKKAQEWLEPSSPL